MPGVPSSSAKCESDPQESSGWGEGALGSEDVGPRTDITQGLSRLSPAFLSCSVPEVSETLAGSTCPGAFALIDQGCNCRSIDPAFCSREATCLSLLTPASLAPNRIPSVFRAQH